MCSGKSSRTMNSARSTPCVLVLPPRSKYPGCHSLRSWAPMVVMISCRSASSSGWIFSSARPSPSSWRRALMRAVVQRLSRSRKTASKLGRMNGSIRRSRRKSPMTASLRRLSTGLSVSAGGRPKPLLLVEGKAEVNESGLVPIHPAQVEPGADQPDLVTDPVSHKRCLGVVENNAVLIVQPAWRLVDLRHDGVKAEGQDAIRQRSVLGIEFFALPSKDVDDLGDLRAE